MAFLLLPTSAFQPRQPLLYNLCHPCVFAGVSSFCFGVGMTALAKNVSLLCCCALLLHQSNISLLQCPPLHFYSIRTPSNVPFRRLQHRFANYRRCRTIYVVVLGACRTCVCREQLHSLHHFPRVGDMLVCWNRPTNGAVIPKGCLGFVFVMLLWIRFCDAAVDLFLVMLLWIRFWWCTSPFPVGWRYVVMLEPTHQRCGLSMLPNNRKASLDSFLVMLPTNICFR